MKYINYLTALIVCTVGVLSMEKDDFRPTVIFLNYGVILFTAVGWCFMVESFIENIFNRKDNGREYNQHF